MNPDESHPIVLFPSHSRMLKEFATSLRSPVACLPSTQLSYRYLDKAAHGSQSSWSAYGPHLLVVASTQQATQRTTTRFERACNLRWHKHTLLPTMTHEQTWELLAKSRTAAFPPFSFAFPSPSLCHRVSLFFLRPLHCLAPAQASAPSHGRYKQSSTLKRGWSPNESSHRLLGPCEPAGVIPSLQPNSSRASQSHLQVRTRRVHCTSTRPSDKT